MKLEIANKTSIDGISKVFEKIGYDSPFVTNYKDGNAIEKADFDKTKNNVLVKDAIFYSFTLLDDAVKDGKMSQEEADTLKTEIRKQNTVEGIANVFKSHGYDDLARIFTNWVKQNYEKRLKDETDKLLRPSSPKVISPPNIIPTTSKTILAENKEAVDAGKEFSELNKKKRA